MASPIVAQFNFAEHGFAIICHEGLLVGHLEGLPVGFMKDSAEVPNVMGAEFRVAGPRRLGEAAEECSNQFVGEAGLAVFPIPGAEAENADPTRLPPCGHFHFADYGLAIGCWR